MERRHHWSDEDDKLIRQHGGSLTADELRDEFFPWRSVNSINHHRRLLSKPHKKRTRFSQKRLIGTTINGRTVTGISPHRSLIAVCERGHEVTLPHSTLRQSDGCGQCKIDDNVTVKDEARGKAPLTPERWLGKVIHGKTIVRLTDPQRVVVVCEHGHEASPVFPDNVLKHCRTCRRERIHRLREEKYLGKKIGERTVLAVEKNKLLVECPEGHQACVTTYRARHTGCGECYKQEQDAAQWIGFSAGGRILVGIDHNRHHIVECPRGHRANCDRSAMHTTNCHQCKAEDSLYRYPEYIVWLGMLDRCNNPKNRAWKYYGGRGIKVLFKDFWEFYNHIKARPSPDLTVNRIDNDGHYEEGNVEWATATQQARNKSDNHNITYQDRTQCAKAWSEELGIKYARILYFSYKGLPAEEIFRLAAMPKQTVKDRLLTAHGVTKTWGEWSEQTGFSVQVIYARVKNGWPPETVVDTPLYKGHQITANGVTHTTMVWSIISGINPQTIRDRIFKHGWTPERAVTEPSMRKEPKGPTAPVAKIKLRGPIFATRAERDFR